ncbi:MAG TPA: MCE-family protein MCE3A, partial [Mycobacterium sp.]
MKRRAGTHRIASAWWALILLTAIVAFLFVTAASFRGTFRSYVPVTLSSDRTGLVMETNAV